MVEIFCKRSELMPSDESVDQHNTKRAEEIADVDKDKNSPEGLFKGTFRGSTRVELLYDEADGILRCPQCQHEHEGGGQCPVCGARFEHPDDDDGYGFSDLDDDADLDLDDLELDVDEEFEGAGHFHHFLGGNFLGAHFPFGHHHIHHTHHHNHDSLGSSSGSDMYSEDDEEDEGSLQDFVVQDEELNHTGASNNGPNSRQPITISDDESDEGGAVSNRRRRIRGRGTSSSALPAPSVVTVSTDSENGDNNDETTMLRNHGWSPLDTENESDAEGSANYRYQGYGSTEDENNSDDESDTNTMRNEASDDDEDRSRNDLSETPTYRYGGNIYVADRGTPSSYLSEDEDGHMGGEFPHAMDRDGDTEMSASPGPPDSSRGVSISTGYGYDEEQQYGYHDQGTPRAHRGESASTDYGDVGENLGGANEIHEIEDDSSDGDIQPPPRRRPRQRHGNPHVQQTDPRISMMFAEHQQSLRGAQNHQQQGLEDLEDEIRRAEPAARNRRLTAYRLQPPRRVDPLRNSRSPSATRIISSSNRVARPPRQYQRRYH